VLSVRTHELDKVEALDRGANDYVVKPFGIAELMARVRAVLRGHVTREAADVIEVGALRIDFGRRMITRSGEEMHLSKKEWELLAFFAGRPDHVVTHKQILREVWGPAHTEDTAYLRVYVNQLRRKLEADPSQPTLIVTDPGVGYRLRLEPA
jgi:two-component system KDP operon response regulator KdpE